jgi:hypothetical protein
MTSLLEVESLSRSEFRSHRRGRRAVLIRKFAKRGLSQWYPEELIRRIGPRPVTATFSATGSFNPLDPRSKIEKRVMPFDEAAACAIDRGDGPYCYVYQLSIADARADLRRDGLWPTWLGLLDHVRATNLWIGAQGCLTPLHVDGSHNFLLQVLGAKRITLFSPDQARFLYPAVDSQRPHLSRIDLRNPDKNEFPLFEQARAEQFTLEPGDVLYLPPGWWHEVESLDAAVSINFWHDAIYEPMTWIRSISAWLARSRASR